MNHLLSIAFLCLLSSISAIPSGQFPYTRNHIVNIHNYYRRHVKYSASNMIKIKWNGYMAKKAEEQARTCKFEHQIDTRYRHGQNLYATSETITNSFDVRKFIYPWARERYADYRRISAPRSSGQYIGTNIFDHYSAMVWSDTAYVGCAYATKCPGSWKSIVVCNYYRAGNVQGRGWYRYGRKCSRCPRGYTVCDNGLCRKP